MADHAPATETAEHVHDLEPEAPEGLDPERAERRAAALAKVVKFGDPVLRSVASPVQEFDDALRAEAERMGELMKEGMGVGLAATQLGILRRILVLQAGPDAPVTALVNPVIEWSSRDQLVTAEEGCLSIPGVVLDVERPLYVRVSALDPVGRPQRIEASGLEARVLQHEMDHLDGVLILQRAPRDQRRGALRALREGGTYAPEREEDEDTAGPDAPEGSAELANGNGPGDHAAGA